MVLGSISGSAFSVSGLDNGEMCFLKNSVAKSGGQTKVADFDGISSITLLLQIKDRRTGGLFWTSNLGINATLQEKRKTFLGQRNRVNEFFY